MKYTNNRLEELYSQGHYETYFMFSERDVPDSIESFHPESSRIHIENDARFCGLKADHFVITEGWDESDMKESVLIMANHKGFLGFTIVKDPDALKWYER